MTWFDAIGAIAGSIVLLLAIGAPLAFAAGARGITFVALSIGASVASVAAASLAAPIIGVSWQWFTPFLVSIPLAVIAFALRRWLRIRPHSDEPRERGLLLWIALGSAAIGAAILAFSVVSSIDPSHPSQTYDGIFHLNAVRWILDTGDASPLHMTMTTPASSSAFYPTVWHAFVALVVPAAGGNIIVASNAFALVVAAMIWPIGCVFLARVIFGANTVLLISTGALSMAFAAFPAQLLWYGILYPNLLAFVLLPIALGLLALALQPRKWPGLSSLALWLSLIWVVAGMSVAHPNALFSFFALSAPLLVHGTIVFLHNRKEMAGSSLRRILVVSALIVVFIVEVLAWTHVATNDSWPPQRPLIISIAEAVTNGPGGIFVAIAATVLTVVGVVVALTKKRYWWLLGTYGIALILFVVSNGWPAGPFRTALTGLWYNDSHRLAALIPVATVPLAALGLATIIGWLQKLVNRRENVLRSRTWLTVTIATACVFAAVVTTQLSAFPQVHARMASAYRFDSTSSVLSPDEADAFELVTKLTPAGSIIAGNPWNGSALVYAYTGHPALFPHVGGRYPDSYWAVAEGIADGTNAACTAAAEIGVHYVLDFGNHFVFRDDPRAAKYPGLTNVGNAPALTLIGQTPGAKLYEVTGCHT